MEHIGIKLSIPSGVATMGASAPRRGVIPLLWEVCLSLGWTMVEGVNGFAT